MFKEGDIVKMKEEHSNISWYTNEPLLVTDVTTLPHHITVTEANKNIKIASWRLDYRIGPEYLELDLAEIRKRKIQHLL